MKFFSTLALAFNLTVWISQAKDVKAVDCKSPAFTCAGKIDGLYADPSDTCASYYFNCISSNCYKFSCPAANPPLVFDPITSSCVYDTQAPGCSTVVPTVPATAGIPTTTATHYCGTFSCTVRADGDYGDPNNGCAAYYFHCANNFCFRQTCSAGLVFNAARDSCDWPVNIAACQSSQPVTQSAPQTVVTQPPIAPTSPNDSGCGAFSCANKHDGDYADPSLRCSQHYFSCYQFQCYRMNCQAGLLYNANNDQCSWPYQIPNC